MAKELKLEITYCDECPFFKRGQWDYDEFVCDHNDCPGNNVITNQTEINEHNRKLIESGRSRHTLFPIPKPENHPLLVPSWCPLPDKKD